MNKDKTVKRLIEMLLEAEPEYQEQAAQFPDSYREQRYLLRYLMNVWDPRCTLSKEYYELQDELLKEKTLEKEPVHPEEIPATKEAGLYFWQGDITLLASDAIVNAANVGLAKLIRRVHLTAILKKPVNPPFLGCLALLKKAA